MTRINRLLDLPETRVLRGLSADARLLFTSRIIRLFGYGLVSIVLVLYLKQLGLADEQVGLLLTLTFIGDAAISLWITNRADRIGRRRMLMLGAGLIILAGVTFGLAKHFLLLAGAAFVGTLSPSGNEVGPFLSIEQAGLAQLITDDRRTGVFAWYNLAGSLATATGALVGGLLARGLQAIGFPPLTSYQVILLMYAVLGVALLILDRRLSSAVEVGEKLSTTHRGLSRSRGIVFRLAALFAVDAFAGGFIVQSLIAYWFSVRFQIDEALIGSIFFWANIFAGLSALAAARLAARFGLVNTMVFTHIPSNILLMLVPLMPTLPLAIAVLLVRFSISQMDVPTRQSYVMAVVNPAERSAAAGVTSVARTVGVACAPVFTGLMLGVGLLSLPFFAAGSLKIVYDLSLYRSFRQLKPPEEQKV
jgi:MFS family permease